MHTKFHFKAHIIDDTLPEANYAQTVLVDLDNDGRPEYVVGQQYGSLFVYKFQTPQRWARRLLGERSPSDVGACALDVDGDGWTDIVTGGAWYRNSRDLEKPFERLLFDPALTGVHDLLAADIDGDGRPEILTMSDKNDLRWYRIPPDPAQPWPFHSIGPAVHAGLSVGDLDGDGDLDVVRTDVWFENVNGDGTQWAVHPIGPNTPPPLDFRPPFAFNATINQVLDMDRDGKNDIVFTDAEIPGGKIWWMENLDGQGRAWQRHEIFVPGGGPRRGAYHSLCVLDLDGDGDFDVLSCEMEAVPGDAPPCYYIWENLDGRGLDWQEHIILDANLGGHAALAGDVTGNGLPDLITKPWRPRPQNSLGGKMFVVFLENLGIRQD
jgi:hypothetical protein